MPEIGKNGRDTKIIRKTRDGRGKRGKKKSPSTLPRERNWEKVERRKEKKPRGSLPNENLNKTIRQGKKGGQNCK